MDEVRTFATPEFAGRFETTSAFSGSLCLKTRDQLPDTGAFAFRTTKSLFLIFGDRDGHAKRLFAFVAFEFIGRHHKPPAGRKG